MTRNRPRTDRDRRPRTVSVSLGDRGQTAQDFAIGIGVFILAVAFVFSFLPTMLTPFDSSTSGGQTAQADRVVDQIVHEYADDDSSNPNAIDLEDFSDDEGLPGELGLRTVDSLNVTVQELGDDSGEEGLTEQQYDEQSAASSARIVAVTNDEDYTVNCDPACRLIVRIW